MAGGRASRRPQPWGRKGHPQGPDSRLPGPVGSASS